MIWCASSIHQNLTEFISVVQFRKCIFGQEISVNFCFFQKLHTWCAQHDFFSIVWNVKLITLIHLHCGESESSQQQATDSMSLAEVSGVFIAAEKAYHFCHGSITVLSVLWWCIDWGWDNNQFQDLPLYLRAMISGWFVWRY